MAGAFVALLLLSGCETTMPNTAWPWKKAEATLVEPVVPKDYDPLELDLGERVEGTEMFAEGEALSALPVSEPLAGQVVLPIREGADPVAPSTAEPYSLADDLTQEVENPNELLEVQLNLDGEDLITVIQMFSYLLGEKMETEEVAPEDGVPLEDAVPEPELTPVPLDEDQFDDGEEFYLPPLDVKPFPYYLDPGVSGSVNFVMETEMTRKEVWKLFQYILWLSGAYISRKEGYVQIMPIAKMPKEFQLFNPTPDPQPNVHVEMIRIYNLTASELAGMIQPYMTDGATATPVQHLNSLMIVETPSNIVKIRELIRQLDVLGETTWPQIAIQCRSVEASIILEELRQILPVIGFGNVTSDQGDGRSVKIIAMERMQVLLASAPTREVLAEIRRWVDVLDREDTREQERIYFYPVKYNPAEDLSDLIGVFFTQTSSSASRSPSSSTTSTNNSASATSSNATPASRRVSASRRSSSSDERPETIFDVPVTLFADGPHNRLIIRTTPRAYAMVKALLVRLDTPPLQVLVQALIAEITLTKNTQYGFRLAALQQLSEFGLEGSLGAQEELGSPFYSLRFGPQTDATNAAPTSALTEDGHLFSFIQAVAGEANTRVLFAPQIIAKSDHSASINVGRSVPILTGTTTNTSSVAVTSSVQYQDTGIILEVTPHITANKLVTLEISQQVSQALDAATDASIRSPTIRNRTLNTSLVLRDGETVMLGGMISSSVTDTHEGMPWVKDLPILGKFVSSRKKGLDREELLLLINVKVIDLESDLDGMVRRYQSAMKAIYDDLEAPVFEAK